MMSDSLAAINVDQLSNAVSAVVNGTPGHTPNTGSVSQSATGLQMPANIPVSIPNAVMVQVDRQLLSQLAASASEVSAMDSTLLQNSVSISGGFQTSTSYQQSGSTEPVITTAGPPATPQGTLLTTQLMAPPSAASGQSSSSAAAHNIALMNAVQMLSSTPSSVAAPPATPQSTPLNQMLGTQMMVPSIVTSMVPAAATSQSTPQSTFLSSPLVLSRNGNGTAGLANAFLPKHGGEQMIFNIQPEMTRGGNSTNSNSNVLQLVPVSNNNSVLTNQQPANQNPMINMSIAIHLPTHGNQDSKDPNATQRQARTVPLSQLTTGQPIPVSQISGPIQMALEQAQERGGQLPSGTPMQPMTQFGNGTQGMSASPMATQLAPDQGQMAGSVLQSQMSIPLSQLTMAQAIPVSQVTTHLSDGTAQQSASCHQHIAVPQHIQIPRSIFKSFSTNSISVPSSALATTSSPTVTSAYATTSTSTSAHAPVVVMGQELQGKSYWNIQSLDHGSQLTSELTSHLTSFNSQTLDVSSMPSVSKAPRQGGVDLGMVSISPDGLVSSMNADSDAATLDMDVTESIETLGMPLNMETPNMWCVDCNHNNPTVCTTHGPPTIIPDAEIPCRAKLTLPRMLKLLETSTNNKNIQCGVIAVENIQPRCQFGPVVGKIVSKNDNILDTDSSRIWQIFRDGTASHFIDVSDENQSNWMRYVRLAGKAQEQNLVAHQSGGNIYFISNHAILKGEELRVWYSQDYAQWRGVPDKPGSAFQCPQCPQQFLQRKQLMHHMGFRHPDMASRRYKCSLCPRAFISNTKLQLHTLTHMGLKPYKCTHCGKQFSDPSNLRLHTRIHTEEKKFICEICHRAFRQKIHLISHMTTHTGEKHLKCPFCDLKFATHATLRQHRELHETDKELPCEKCDRKFKSLRILQKHMKTHTSKRDFKCQSCNKAFFTRYHAKRHHQNCRGLGDQGHTKGEDRKDDRGDGEPKPGRRRGRPAKHQRKASEDSTLSIVQTTHASISREGHYHREASEYSTQLQLPTRRQNRSSIRGEPRMALDGRGETPRGGIRGPKRGKDRAARESVTNRPGHDGFVHSGASSLSRMDTGSSSPRWDTASERGKRQRLSSKRGLAVDAASSSQGGRHSGRPVRQRKMPKRYTSEEDRATDKQMRVRDAKRGRDENRDIYNWNVVHVRVGEQASSDGTNARNHAFGGNTRKSPYSLTASDDTRTASFSTSHTLHSSVLEDSVDSAENPSVSLSPLMGSDSLQSTSWDTSIRMSPLDCPLRTIGQRVSETVGSLPIATSSSSQEEGPSSSSVGISQSVETDSPLEMPGTLYAVETSPMAMRSMSMQMRQEPTSDMEANDQCDDEERDGTVNDNVEE